MTPTAIYSRAKQQCRSFGGSCSLPVLIDAGGAVSLGLFIYPSQLNLTDGKIAYPATHVGRFSLDDGELVELHALPKGDDEALGSDALPEGYDFPRYDAERTELLDEMVALAPAFRARSTEPTERMRRQLERYERLCSPVLAPTLRVTAPEMFAWLESARRKA
ncbi:MAG: hypothetical protein AB7S26_22755 [Sandaracinaceae bacterium]